MILLVKIPKAIFKVVGIIAAPPVGHFRNYMAFKAVLSRYKIRFSFQKRMNISYTKLHHRRNI